MKNYDEFAREIITRFGDDSDEAVEKDKCIARVIGWHMPTLFFSQRKKKKINPRFTKDTPLKHDKKREDVTEPDFYPEKPYVLVMERGST